MALGLDGRIELIDGMAFRGESGSGHAIVMDSAAAHGGQDRGARPMEVVLLALGGCTGMDVISILRKMRQDVTAYEVRVHGERTEEQPTVFTEIIVEHVVRGRGVERERVRRAVELSATRYCPVSAMLSKTARVEERYRVIDETTGEEFAAVLAKSESPAATA